MDELIRELRKDLATARTNAGAARDEEMRTFYAGQADASFRHLSWAREARRRLAEQEPAWTVEP